jgi:hypothetical protein
MKWRVKDNTPEVDPELEDYTGAIDKWENRMIDPLRGMAYSMLSVDENSGFEWSDEEREMIRESMQMLRI